MTNITTNGADFFKPLSLSFHIEPSQRVFLALECERLDQTRAYDRIGGYAGGFWGAFMSFALPRAASYSKDQGTLYLGEKTVFYRTATGVLHFAFSEILNFDASTDGCRVELRSGSAHLFKCRRKLNDTDLYNWPSYFEMVSEWHEHGWYLDENLNLVMND